MKTNRFAVLAAGLATLMASVGVQAQTSVEGAYEGDCFEVGAVTKENPYKLAPTTRYLVQSQRDMTEASPPAAAASGAKAVAGTDKMLRVVEADKAWSFGPSYFCKTKGTISSEVPASEFVKIGAERLGWTYGMLTLPFKYYPGDKSLKASGALGPYVGRRSGAAGSAITFAATAAVGAVQGEAVDDTGAVTNPSLFAVSLAMGWMFDISKTPGGKPFKMGIFVGKDFVGSDNAAKYPNNRKTWVAFQLGFDFTDN